MTRINCIPVQELADKHLVAEWKEIQRLPKLVLKAIERGEKPNDPKFNGEYTMGKGHVVFFYNKLEFIDHRMIQLHNEMICRGFQPNMPEWWWPTIKEFLVDWFGYWRPTEKAMQISRQRIEERLGK